MVEINNISKQFNKLHLHNSQIKLIEVDCKHTIITYKFANTKLHTQCDYQTVMFGFNGSTQVLQSYDTN